MKVRVARWLQRRLLEHRNGKAAPPGGSQNFRIFEPTGAELTLVARGDSFDCYHGTRNIYSFALEASTLVSLAKWVLLTWWARSMWFGWKLRLWNWAIAADPLPAAPVIRIDSARKVG